MTFEQLSVKSQANNSSDLTPTNMCFKLFCGYLENVRKAIMSRIWSKFWLEITAYYIQFLLEKKKQLPTTTLQRYQILQHIENVTEDIQKKKTFINEIFTYIVGICFPYWRMFFRLKSLIINEGSSKTDDFKTMSVQRVSS